MGCLVSTGERLKFDFVVVANGHYRQPAGPDTPLHLDCTAGSTWDVRCILFGIGARTNLLIMKQSWWLVVDRVPLMFAWI